MLRALLLAVMISAAAAQPMPVGVDEAGSPKWITDDAQAQEAFERIGFDFMMHHFWTTEEVSDIDRLDQWAAAHNHRWLINGENSAVSRIHADPAVYRRPGGFWQPPKAYVERCLASPRFLGFCFDECEHWICNGTWVTVGRPFEPHFFDAEGLGLADAYAGNLENLQRLMARVYPGFAERARQTGASPIVGTEGVLPILHHLFARAGLVQMPKLLKETITPVTLAMTMGAAREYGVQHWTSIDLWGMGKYPGHTPEELRSALLLSYWTGAERTYIENFAYRGSLYSVQDGHVTLSPHGEATRQFIADYLPKHPQRVRFADFRPQIIIVRFPDTDWGQTELPWIRPNLYGARNLLPDPDTRNQLKIWHVISHGTIPLRGLNYNTPLGIPYRVLFPANNVAVYDHRAADPSLFAAARLVFLTGKQVEPECLATLRRLVPRGLTVVTTRRLAPPEYNRVGQQGYGLYHRGHGRWIVCDDVTLPAVRALLAPELGRPDELRYVFGDQEVVFTTPVAPDRLEVRVAPLAAAPG